MNLETANEIAKILKENMYRKEFYPVLLLCERFEDAPNRLNEKVLDAALNAWGNNDYPYNEDLMDDIDKLKGLLSKNKNKEMER